MQNKFILQKISQYVVCNLFSVILENHIKPKKYHSHDFHQRFLFGGNAASIYTAIPTHMSIRLYSLPHIFTSLI